VRKLLAEGRIVVVETEDDWFLGTAEIAGDTFIVRSDFAGRPVIVDAEAVQGIIPAQGHPNVTERLPVDEAM